MARDSLDSSEYAIKFFISTQAFEAEKALYSSDAALAQFLPKVWPPTPPPLCIAHFNNVRHRHIMKNGLRHAWFTRLHLSVPWRLRHYSWIALLQVRDIEANTEKKLMDAHGHPLPPFIVMERGEPLDVWAARAKPDRPLAFAVLLSPYHDRIITLTVSLCICAQIFCAMVWWFIATVGWLDVCRWLVK
jgi:hypothetical protein